MVLTVGTSFPDALSATALAGLEGDAPIVLTTSDTLSAQAATTISSLSPSQVLVIGGAGAIKEAVLDSIRALVPSASVNRIWGSTSIDTARAIYTSRQNLWGDIAIIVRGDAFEDAVSIAPYAYANHYPIFQVAGPTVGLDSATLNSIANGGFSKVIIIGGRGALSAQVETQLQGRGFASNQLERWYGSTSYDTSAVIAVNSGLSFNNMAVATAKGFSDALAGAALCGKTESVLCLVDEGVTAGYVCVDGVMTANKNSIYQGYFLGGNGVVTPATQARIKALWR